MQLKFPPTGGGEEHGLNDPGIETFEGNFGGHLARECSQNVGDAAATDGSPVRITFTVFDLSISQIPCAGHLEGVFKSCAKFWADNPKTIEFFKTAQKQIHKRAIRVMRISDFGTTGLTGGDAERDGKWYCLVRSGGVSNKTEGTGGSFGIGKFAPFAASAFRTVLYSTRTIDGKVAFQGVSRLVSHEDEKGETTQGTGYIGEWSERSRQFTAIRKDDAVPEPFRRTEPGTDIYVLGYRDGDGWERHLTRAVLQHFWPAIARRKIEFQVGDVLINYDTLAERMQEFSTEPEFDAHLYLRAFTAPDRREFSTEIPGLGRVQLYLATGTEEYPKRVALTRKNGMVVMPKRFNSRKPYTGYFVCENKEGNEQLRSLEPPRHDTWEDPDRGTPEARRLVREAFAWIRQCIKELNPALTATSLDVPDLARYLPDDSPDGEEEVFVKNADRGPEGAFKQSAPQRPMPVQTDPTAPPQQQQWQEAVGEHPGGGTGGSDKNGGGGGGTGAGGDDNTERGGKGRRRSRKSEPGPSLILRSIVTEKGYRLVIRSDRDFEGGLRLNAIGDDGGEDPVDLDHAMSVTGGNAVRVSGAVMLGVSLRAGTPEIVDVRLRSPGRLALSVKPQ
jgi:hypothetical protein